MQEEINILKNQVKELQNDNIEIKTDLLCLKASKETIGQPSTSKLELKIIEETEEAFINEISRIQFQKWHVYIRININQELDLITQALVDTGADQNSIREGLIPTKYYEKNKRKIIWS